MVVKPVFVYDKKLSFAICSSMYIVHVLEDPAFIQDAESTFKVRRFQFRATMLWRKKLKPTLVHLSGNEKFRRTITQSLRLS